MFSRFLIIRIQFLVSSRGGEWCPTYAQYLCSGSFCIARKSINSWLAKVRKGAEPYYGQNIRPYASHTYRHTLAMRMLDNGVSYENIARILGDTVATIEAHCSELVMTRDFRKAMETVYGGSDVKTTEGTAQPEWLDRFRKVRTSNLHKPLIPHSRGTDSKWVADVPGFENQHLTFLAKMQYLV
jgi:hypothetical protein